MLTHVIIVRLPFAVPDSPIEQARADWIEAQGRSSFREFALPMTSMKLCQAVGRLLRKETDFGAVTVLDTRLVRTRWGRELLDALPPFRLVDGATEAWRAALPTDLARPEQRRHAA